MKTTIYHQNLIKAFIALFFLAFLFIPAKAINKRTIIWNKIGQKETLKRGEVFDFIYKDANPENSRIVIKPSVNPDEFILELTRYNTIDRAIENKKSEHIANDSLVKLLKQENSNLTLRVQKNNIYVEYDSLITNKIDRLNERSKVINEPHSGKKVLTEKISNLNKNISEIEKEYNNNQNEIASNLKQIGLLKSKIGSLGNSNEDILLSKTYNFQMDSLNKRNEYLTQVNKLLNKDKELLSREKLINEFELARQKDIRNLFLIIAIIAIIFAVIYYRSYRKIKRFANLISRQKEIISIEMEKSDRLLLNILPKQIVGRLKQGETAIADRFEEASVVFIDIVDFTKKSSGAPPERIVEVLNKIYTEFDKIAQKHKLEKIKTIGDCYMAAAGIPETNEKHAELAAKFAMEAMQKMNGYDTGDGTKINFRCGIDCGPAIAGVIGEQKFIYDIWGDMVNTASRLETNGVSGKIQCTDRFKEKLEPGNSELGIKFEERGELEIKGKGMMKIWFLSVSEHQLNIVHN